MARLAFSLILLMPVLVCLSIFLYFFFCWRLVRRHDLPVPLVALIGMKLRHVSPKLVIQTLIKLKNGGVTYVPYETLEAHYLCGGDISAVADRIVAEAKAGRKTEWMKIFAEDLKAKAGKR